MTRVGVVVQARMGSARFPGKMLASLGEHTLLEWVLRRVSRARRVDRVVLATTDLSRDDALVELAKQLQVEIFRGDETDVLGRLAAAANKFELDTVIRVCADNPFVDPQEIDRLIDNYNNFSCDYACNHQDRLNSRYADGFGAEVLSNDLLQKIAGAATETKHREHATLFVWDNQKDYNLYSVSAPSGLAYPQLRFDVDQPQDLAYLEELVGQGVTIESPARDIVQIAQRNLRTGDNESSSDISSEFDVYLKRLFPLCRSITGEPNRETLRVLQEIIPLTIHEIPTGTQVYNWIIPDEWTIYDAWIDDSNGNRIVDFKTNNLHIVSYSVPVRGQMTWNELKSHVHRHPDLPNAIPYRTSYYNRDWGFCVTHAQYEVLAATKGPLTVVVDSELKSGSMSYGEYLIPGRSSKEILLSCYICHPSMANDSLSGVLLTAFLARQIASIKDLHWSYRVVFVPETIGSIAYCAKNEAAMKAIDAGLVITTVGGPGKFSFKESYNSSHIINRMVESVLSEKRFEYIKYPFDIHGSDERQYSSPGFRINCVSICKDKYYEYDEYHTSKDNLDFVCAEYLEESYDLYLNLIFKIETQKIYKRTDPHCEIMLSRHRLYPTIGASQLPKSGVIRIDDIFLWILYYTDGLASIEEISNLTSFSVNDIEDAYSQLQSHSLVEEL